MITDIVLLGDIAGAGYAVSGRGTQKTVRANQHALVPPIEGGEIAELACLWIPALATEVRRRPDLHLTAVGRRDAHGRIAAMIAGVYEGLWRQEPISCPTFNLPPTQSSLGIAMTHVGRTLRRMHEERVGPRRPRGRYRPRP